MWKTILGWIKSVFGGGVTSQIGKSNQSLSGSSTGDNSPVLMAARDVHLHSSAAGHTPELSSIFVELEETLPEFLGELQESIKHDPLVRDIIVLDTKSIVYCWPDEHFRFSEDEHPGIWKKMRVLEDCGLVSELKDRFAFRLSQKLVNYLKKRQERTPK